MTNHPSNQIPQIPGYVLLTKLGQGATAQVYSARRLLDDAVVALKILHSGLAQHEDVRRRMLSEVETAVLLKHPHIVQVQGLIPDTNPPAFSMDFIDGPSLAEFQGRLPYILPEVSVLIMIDVLAGLEHAHSQGVIHRDMKPSNILISRDGRALITDFGLARISEAPTITMAGTILGSPDYMSPEQARGDVLTKRSDLFSSAAVLYFLLTGTRPFGKPSPLATLVAVSNAEFEPVQKRNPKVSASLCRIINKGLSKNPHDRFQSAEEFRKALQFYLKSMGLDGNTLTLPQWMATPSESTMHALKATAETLYRRCEQELSEGDRDGAFETMSHLSLVAPDSAALVELMQKVEESTAPAPSHSHESNRKGFATALLGGTALLIFMVLMMPQLQHLMLESADQGQKLDRANTEILPRRNDLAETKIAGYSATTADAKPIDISNSPAVSAVTKSTTVPTNEINTSKKVSISPEKFRGLVRFDVPKGVRVVFDGREINPSKPLRTTPGGHKILLEKPGFPPIVQVIKVDDREPTDITVN